MERLHVFSDVPPLLVDDRPTALRPTEGMLKNGIVFSHLFALSVHFTFFFKFCKHCKVFSLRDVIKAFSYLY